MDALSEKAQESFDNAEKRKAFSADLAISEAEASGNQPLAGKLKWNRDREKLQKELEAMGSTDSWGESARMVNAGAAKPEKPEKPNFEKSVVSAMHAVGTGRGEVYAAQDKNLSEIKKTNGILTEIKTKMKDGNTIRATFQ
ncbi:MAG: hypothetical protein D4R65_10085 [Verrucomicrobiaceae bacterium]|nr:MAG: hypothetical protein D4R65_10085 [Verrucomicrobiaceae bacterium]